MNEQSLIGKTLKDLALNIYHEKNMRISNMTELHYHHHYEIYYLLSGSQKYFIEDSYFNVQKGDCVLIPKNTIHKTTNGMGGLRLLLNFNDAFLSEYLSPRAKNILLQIFEQRVISPSVDISKTLLTYSDKIEEAIAKKDMDELFLYLFKFLTMLCDCPARNPTTEKRGIPLIHAITEYTQNHYGEINNLDEVANALYISKYHLCHLCTKYLSISYNEYLTKIRLKNAEEKLLSTNLSITEISELCGFHTTTYFCYVFKKQFSISPLKYRNMLTQTK